MAPSSLHPWEGVEHGYGARLGFLLLSALLLVVTIVSFLVAFGIGISLAQGTALPDSTTSNLIAVAIAVVICVAGIASLVALWPHTRGQARFTPSYGVIAPTTIDHPFDVRFERYLWGRSMRGAGTVQFTPTALTIAGNREPHPAFQLGIVLVVSLGPLILFGFGLGLIPALLIAYYVGRQRVSMTIPYPEIQHIMVKRRTVTLRSTQSPQVIMFGVAAGDGERLYRELGRHFPAVVAGMRPGDR